jgi:TfoX/Sxy family transcriptional regulator of competence genes
MASSNDYLVYVLDLLRDIPGIHYKKMMGEYLLYCDSVLFGGIYDNRFLVKKTESSIALGLTEAIPYPGAKPMLVLDLEDARAIKEVINGIVADLNAA